MQVGREDHRLLGEEFRKTHCGADVFQRTEPMHRIPETISESKTETGRQQAD